MRPSRRLVIFLAIGILNTVIDVSLFLGLRQLAIPIIIANVISTSIALAGSYILNKRFAFHTQGDAKRSLPLFVAVTLAGLWLLQPLVIKIVLTVEHSVYFTLIAQKLISHPQRYYELIAKLAATPFTLVWNYLLYKKIVFKNQS